jgi:hypothetical protein
MPHLRRLVAGSPQRRTVFVHARSSGFCGGQSDTWVGFLRVLRLPLLLLVPPTAPHSLITSHAKLHRLDSDSVVK